MLHCVSLNARDARKLPGACCAIRRKTSGEMCLVSKEACERERYLDPQGQTNDLNHIYDLK